MFRYVPFFCTLFFASFCFGQNYIIENHVLEKGLPFVEITNVFQSKKGFIYLSGYAGITQYDGKTFKSVAEREGLDDYSVKVSVADQFDPSVIWIGTPSGLNKRNEKVFQKQKNKRYLSGESIRSIKFTDKVMFVTTTKEIYSKRKNQEVFQRIPIQNIGKITCSEILIGQEFLIGTTTGLFRYNTKTHVSIKILDIGMKQIFKEGNTFQICSGNGFFTLTINQNNLIVLSDVLLKEYDVRSAFSKYGMTYIATNNGLFVVDKSRKISEIKFGSTLPQKFVNSVILDYEDNVWVGTNSGVFKISVSPFESFGNPPKDGSASFIFEIIKDEKGLFWVGSNYSGVSYLDDKLNFHHFDLGKKNANCYGLLLDENKNLWIGTNNGLYLKKLNNSFLSFNNGMTDVQAFLENPKTMYVGSFNAVLEYDKITFKELNRFMLPLVNHNGIICLKRYSKNELLLGCYGQGLFLLNTKTGKFISLRDEIQTSSVFEIILLPSGEFAMATPIGVVILTKNLKRKKVICSADGMISDLIYSLFLDGNDLLAGSNQGMCVIDIRTIDKRQVNIKSFNKRDGFDGIECNTNGFYKNEDGSFLVGTVNGIFKYKPWLVKASKTQLKPIITNFKLFYKDTLLPNYCKLSNKNNQLTFNFSSISFNHADRINYSFYLKGYDKEWTPSNASESASYSNLPPGEYVFCLKSNSSNGNWNGAATKFHFTILSPFYLKWWFITICILVVLGIIALLESWRRLKIKENEAKLMQMVANRTKDLQQEKEKVVVLIKEIHHRVKNNLQSITSLINLHSRFITDEKALEVFEESKHRIKTMSLVHERLFETNDLNQITVEDFIKKIVQYLLESAGKQNVIKVHFDIQVDKFHLDTVIPLGLFVNEAISNALKYAFTENKIDSEIHIALYCLEKKQFKLTIIDNGLGFDYEQKREENSSFGLELMGLLAEQLNGVLSYYNNSEQALEFYSGSTFKLLFFDIGKSLMVASNN